MIKVVLDTNVLISGLLWQGAPSHLLKLVDKKHLAMCLNEAMLTELAGVLERKKFSVRLKSLGFEAPEIVAIVAEKAFLFENIHIPNIIREDPDDNYVLACAIASNARYIVSGDAHLLNLGRFKNIRILTPSKALNLFQP